MSKSSFVFIISCLAFVACNGCSDESPVPADATSDLAVDVAADVSVASDSPEAAVDAGAVASDAHCGTSLDATVPGC